MAVARDDLGRAARKRGIEGQVTIIRYFGMRCIQSEKYDTPESPDDTRLHFRHGSWYETKTKTNTKRETRHANHQMTRRRQHTRQDSWYDTKPKTDIKDDNCQA